MTGPGRDAARGVVFLRGEANMSYRFKLVLLTAAIFVGLSLAIANIVAKVQFLASLPSD
jgi:hypothetical protein